MIGSRGLWAATLCLGLVGCVLPDFEKVEASTDDAGAADATPDAGGAAAGPACGRSDELPEACDLCIRENCCDLAEECGDGTDCGDDLLEPIAPTSDFSADFDPLLGCMQRHCDAACEVNWGCLDDYEWPRPDEDVEFEVRVVDFAAVPEEPLADVTVRACQAVDPACESGQVSSGETGTDGTVALTVQPDFGGFFTFEGGGYTRATVRWSEPLYRIADWTQFQLTEEALQALALVTGVHENATDTFDPSVGHLIFRVQGCLPVRYLGAADLPRAEVPGVSVSFEPSEGASQTFYTDDSGGVSITLEQTTKDGVGGAFSVPPRSITVVATDEASGVEVAQTTIRIPATHVGFVYLIPRSL